MEEKLVLRVSICGKRYTVTTDEDKLLIERAAEMVDTLMVQKASLVSGGTIDQTKIAVVTALQLATEMLKKERELKLYERRAAEMVSLLSD
jgi:cell division protein ZapA (FtsZ GTPase activity inhibitor)